MTINDVLNVFNRPIKINRFADGKLTTVADSRKGGIPRDLLEREVTFMTIEKGALVLEYNDD